MLQELLSSKRISLPTGLLYTNETSMKIGFDLDRVFINTPPGVPAFIIERLYRKSTKTGLVYRIPSKKEQIIRQISHAEILRPPIKNNLAFLYTISQNNNTLYLISSRFSFLRNATEKLVNKYNLPKHFKDIYFNFENQQPHIFKSDIINKLHLDVFVDDDLHLLKYIASRNNKIKLYWLNKHQNKKLGPNITAITNIADILKEK